MIYKLRSLHRKDHIKIDHTTTSFYSKKDLKLIKNKKFLVEKLEIQVIVFMIMPTLSSEWILDPMRYTGSTYTRSQTFLGSVTEID